MEINADELRTLFTGLAVAVSLFSLLLSHRAWIRSNRPIVVAAIETLEGGNLAIPLNLTVMNSGNRPALRIRFHAKKSDITKILHNPSGRSIEEAIYKCFSADAEIPLLLDGKTVTNSFGFLSVNKDNSSWIDKSTLKIKVSYFDLDGRKYKSVLNLVIKGEKGFAGSIWNERKNIA